MSVSLIRFALPFIAQKCSYRQNAADALATRCAEFNVDVTWYFMQNECKASDITEIESQTMRIEIIRM